MRPAGRASSTLGCAMVCVMAASGQPVTDTMSPAQPAGSSADSLMRAPARRRAGSAPLSLFVLGWHALALSQCKKQQQQRGHTSTSRGQLCAADAAALPDLGQLGGVQRLPCTRMWLGTVQLSASRSVHPRDAACRPWTPVKLKAYPLCKSGIRRAWRCCRLQAQHPDGLASMCCSWQGAGHTCGAQHAHGVPHGCSARCNAPRCHAPQEGVPVNHGHQHGKGRLHVTACQHEAGLSAAPASNSAWRPTGSRGHSCSWAHAWHRHLPSQPACTGPVPWELQGIGICSWTHTSRCMLSTPGGPAIQPAPGQQPVWVRRGSAGRTRRRHMSDDGVQQWLHARTVRCVGETPGWHLRGRPALHRQRRWPAGG